MTSLEYISTFSRLGTKTKDLSRIGSLLKALGDPQKDLNFIHIAGTNGKGSMAQMFNEILKDAGYRVGLFTSPYIISFYDRIQINSSNISSNELDEIIDEISPVIEAHPMRGKFSQFEITQAAAFIYFKKKKCDVVVLEAGLGGLLDSTNIIDCPLVCAIGSIALDHTAILGNTVTEIAVQKAGIIKKDCPCVLSAGNQNECVKIFREKSYNLQAEFCIPDIRNCRIIKEDISGSEFEYNSQKYRLSMPGRHQISNALTVIESIKMCNESISVSYDNIYNGIAKARLYGRVEVISDSPLTILDGSHNSDGMKALAKTLELVKDKKIIAVIGMHNDKNANDAVCELIPYISEFYVVSGFSDRDYSLEELSGIIKNCGGNAECVKGEIIPFIKQIREIKKDDIVLICGSLYLVSYIKDNKI